VVHEPDHLHLLLHSLLIFLAGRFFVSLTVQNC
jgi:hypothetical protein